MEEEQHPAEPQEEPQQELQLQEPAEDELETTRIIVDEKNAALFDHGYDHTKDGKVVFPMPRQKDDQFKWSEDETRKFLELRRKHIDKFYLGKRGSIQRTYSMILEEMGLLGKVTPSQARKKWNNMSQLYKRLATQPRYRSGKSKDYYPLITWQFFNDVGKTIELEPHIQPGVNPEGVQIDGTNLEELSDQLNARIIQVAFEGSVAGQVSLDGDKEGVAVCKPPPRKRAKKNKEEILHMITDLAELNRQQEDILCAKNKLMVTLLSQMV